MNSIFTGIKIWIAMMFLVAAFGVSEATIVYHDENPDVTKTQTTNGTQKFDIDMNDDATVDFTLSVFMGDTSFSGTPLGTVTGNGTAVYIDPASGNFTSEESSSPVSTVAAYDAGNTINSALTWQSEISLLRFNGNAISPPIIAGPISYGDFTGSLDKYIGVKFTVGVNTYYGWIRVAVSDNGDSYTLKDWAYENTTDMSIDAGATTTTAVNKRLVSTTTIVNKNNIIEVNFADQLSGTISAMNMSGVMTGSVKFNGTSCVVNMQNKPSGVYTLIFETSAGEFFKKVFVY